MEAGGQAPGRPMGPGYPGPDGVGQGPGWIGPSTQADWPRRLGQPIQESPAGYDWLGGSNPRSPPVSARCVANDAATVAPMFSVAWRTGPSAR